MTIENTYSPTKVSGDGVTLTFDFDFRIYDDDEVKVSLIDKDSEVKTEKTLTTDYSVTIDTVEEGGTITFVTEPTADEWVFIESIIPDTQTTSFPLDGKLREENIELMGDRNVRLMQQINEKNTKTIALAAESDDDAPEFPALVTGKVLSNDGTDLEWIDAEIPDGAYTVSTSATLAENSDSYLATQKAIKTYADLSVKLTGDQTIAGDKDFSDDVTISGTTNVGTLKIAGTGSITSILDEDAMGSNSAVALATQQSIKAYADTLVAAAKTIKGYINFNGTGTVAINGSYNVSALADNGTGDYTITWDTDFANDDYAVVAIGGGGKNFAQIQAIATGSVQITCFNEAGTAQDGNPVCVIAIGTQ